MSKLPKRVKELLWSAWSELGLPGGGRSHKRIVIDPEPLIVFTPCLAQDDPRLLNLVFDWCVQHSEHVSRARLAILTRQAPLPVGNAMKRFAGALARHGIDWQPRGKPLLLDVDRHAIPLPLERPALVILRMRALTGMAGRADILSRLLFAGAVGVDTAALGITSVSQRSVERVLNQLEAAGHVLAVGSPRKRRFRLRQPVPLTSLLGARRLIWPDWVNTLSLAHTLSELASSEALSSGLRRVAAVKTRGFLAECATSLGVSEPPDLKEQDNAFDLLMEWGTATLADIATGLMNGALM